jgi:hypothetical protein
MPTASLIVVPRTGAIDAPAVAIYYTTTLASATRLGVYLTEHDDKNDYVLSEFDGHAVEDGVLGDKLERAA